MKRHPRWNHLRSMAAVVVLAAPLLAVGQTRPSRPGRSRRALQRLLPEPPKGTKALRNLEYARVGEVSVKLDLYIPPHAKGVPLPVVVWVHGGGWHGGDKARNPGLALLAKGYASASINYRLTGVASFPAQIHDCKAAIRWLRANAEKYDLDPKRIGVWGASAGGHLAALLGTSGGSKVVEGKVGGNLDKSSRVQAVCDFFGPTDLLALAKHFKVAKDAGTDSLLTKLFGGAPEKHFGLVRLANPINFVSDDDPPFLIVHGDKDRLVPLSQSKLLHEALKESKVSSTLHVVKGGRHGPGVFVPEVLKMVGEFFDKHLKQTKATTQPAHKS